MVVEPALEPALSAGLGEWRPLQAPGVSVGGWGVPPLPSEKWTGCVSRRLAVPGSGLWWRPQLA